LLGGVKELSVIYIKVVWFMERKEMRALRVVACFDTVFNTENMMQLCAAIAGF